MNIQDKLLNKLTEKILGYESDMSVANSKIDNYFMNKKVIIRTYSAGIHYGTIIEKENKEVILKDARRLWYWKTANNGISLSEVAKFGLHGDSRVTTTIDLIWLEAIEIIPCTEIAIKSIEAQNEYKA